MATARKWSNIQIAMQSALASPVTISAITKAAEGVCTATNTYSNGDYVFLLVQGMYQLDGRVARVKSVAGGNFTLEGIDTTAFDTFVSGTAEKITFGTTVSTATTVSSSGGGFDMIDITTIHDNAKKEMPGLASASTFSFENIWDVSDAGLIAMKNASDAQAKRAFRFTFGSGGQIMAFAGYVGATLLPGGSAQDKVTTSTTITMQGSPSYYAS
jgi:hypothetical protein